MNPELSAVQPKDADSLVRNVDFPAMQDGPLFRVMFPSALSDDEIEAIQRWYCDGLEQILLVNHGKFRQIIVGGVPVGFCGWTLEQTGQSQISSRGLTQSKPVQQPIPDILDLGAWRDVSTTLSMERKRVLKGLENVCRLIFVMVHPANQRQGLGSLLMQWFCDEADRHGRHAYVLSSPAGIRLYKKFGFQEVGHVQTIKGVITSMLRCTFGKPGCTAAESLRILR